MSVPDSPPAVAPKSKRRRLRLSLRGLMLLVCILGGWLGWVVHEARIQQQAVLAIERTGGNVYYNWQLDARHEFDPYARPPAPPGLMRWLGLDFFGHVVEVNLGTQATDTELEQVTHFRHLIAFNNWSPAITDDQAAHLADLPDFERMVFHAGSRVTRAMWANLGRATKLTTLTFGGVLLDGDLAHLKGLTNLRELNLASPAITDAGLVHLQGLTRLHTLTLRDITLTEAGVANFQGMKDLTKFMLFGSRTSSEVVAALRRDHPGIFIYR